MAFCVQQREQTDIEICTRTPLSICLLSLNCALQRSQCYAELWLIALCRDWLLYKSGSFLLKRLYGSKVCTHRSQPCPQRSSLAVRNLCTASDERMVCFLAGYSFLYYCAGLVCLKKERHGRSYDGIQQCLSVNSDLGWALAQTQLDYSSIVGLFKHFLRVRAHPQFFGLELRAPMGAYVGQYGMNCVKPVSASKKRSNYQ